MGRPRSLCRQRFWHPGGGYARSVSERWRGMAWSGQLRCSKACRLAVWLLLLIPAAGCRTRFVAAVAPGPAPAWTSAIETPRLVRARTPWIGEAGLASIQVRELTAWVSEFAHGSLNGRPTPSSGLRFVLDRIAGRFAELGLLPGSPERAPGTEGTYRHAFGVEGLAPDLLGTWVRIDSELDSPPRCGAEFSPVRGAGGRAAGPALFVGHGRSGRGFDDLADLGIPKDELVGSIALFFEGEPGSLHDPVSGPGAPANLFAKLENLRRRGVSGALVIRRPFQGPALPGYDPDEHLDFRGRHASWVGERPDFPNTSRLPALWISLAFAEQLTGADLRGWWVAQEKLPKPLALNPDRPPVSVAFGSATRVESRLPAENILGLLPGSDPLLARELIVVGAHADHIGVDLRGRAAPGADDNASGCAVVLELAEALALAPPRRSILFCAFTGEEGGLLGSRALVRDLQAAQVPVAAMVNLDMVGRGDPSRLTLLGLAANPSLKAPARRAVTMASSRTDAPSVAEVSTADPDGLFERSDHFPFHEAGIPALYLFEQAPLALNPDYHSYRDRAQAISHSKLLSVGRFAYCLIRLLADEPAEQPVAVGAPPKNEDSRRAVPNAPSNAGR